MAAYALRRIFWTIPILFLVLTLIFFAMKSIGGDPLRHGRLVGLSSAVWVKSGDPKPESITANMRRELGLDEPWYEQYGEYLVAAATFDFGATFTFRYRTVEEIIAEQAPISIELGLLALAWALVIGLPLGVAGALRAGSALDYGARTLAMLGLAVPNFLVATLLIYVFAVRGGVLPTSGWHGWESKVLPSFTLALLPAAYCARLVRGAMLEVLQQDYVRAAAARGLRRRRIVVAHVLRNSLGPFVSALGPLLGYLVTGSFVVEQVFGIPGIGRYFVAGVLARDYPLVLGLTVVLTIAMVAANLLADLLHAMLDPRVREQVVTRA
jgi:oligopeptide transport system permease protein